MLPRGEIRMSDPWRLGLLWAFASAIGGALFSIPWRLANLIGDPSLNVLLLLSLAAAANTLMVIAQPRGGASRIPGRIDFQVGFLLAAFTLFGNLASARAIQDLSPAVHNVMLRGEVIAVALMAWVFLGEKVEGRFWIGAATAVVGLLLLQGPFEGGSSVGVAGTGMAMLAVVCFSALSVVTRHYVHRIDVVTVNAIRLWLSVLLWFPVFGLPSFDQVPGEQVLWASLAALCGPFLGRLCLMQSSRYVEARVSTLANLTTPALTLLLAFLFLSEWPTTWQLVGGAVMIAGIAVPILGGMTTTPRASPS